LKAPMWPHTYEQTVIASLGLFLYTIPTIIKLNRTYAER